MTKVISLSDNAYSIMKSLKHGDESFSDVVLKLTDKAGHKSLLEFYGKWPGTKEELNEIENILEKDRKRFKVKEVKF